MHVAGDVAAGQETRAPKDGVQAPPAFDLAKILQSKREFRQRLAARPIAEKLAMLDALRARAIALRESRSAAGAGGLREEPPPYRGQPNQAG